MHGLHPPRSWFFPRCQMHAVTRTFAPSIRQLPRSQLSTARKPRLPRAPAEPTRASKLAGAVSPRSAIARQSRPSLCHPRSRAFGSLVYPLTLHPDTTAAAMADTPYPPCPDAMELSPEELAHVFSELQDPHADNERRHRLERLIMMPAAAAPTGAPASKHHPEAPRPMSFPEEKASKPVIPRLEHTVQAIAQPRQMHTSHSPCARERLIGYLPLEPRTAAPPAPPGTSSS